MDRGWMCVVVSAGLLAAGGCGIGKNKMLMVTKTNIGIAAETTPQPNAEISSSRSEALVSPVFGEGKTPAAIAGISVAAKTGVFQSGIGSAFAVGDAAMTLTDVGAARDGDHDATLEKIPLHEAGDANRPSWVDPMLKPRPVYFATDTAFGLKAAWGGTAGPYPDRAIIGYNRKEGTLAPLQAKEDPTNSGKYTIDAPSLIATVTIGSGAGKQTEGEAPTNATFKQQQFFATGEAATRLGKLKEVRESVFRQVDPGVAEYVVSGAYQPIPCADELGNWIDADDANFALLQAYLSGIDYPHSPLFLMNTGATSGVGTRVCEWFEQQQGED
jgi:hypothetical protein